MNPFKIIRTYGIKSIIQNIFSLMISDVHVVSFEKCGRTWLRVMIAKLIAKKLKKKRLNLDTQFMTLGKAFPNIVFSHAGGNQLNNKINFKKLFKNKKIIFLVRDPRDLIVSLYHEYTKRRKIYAGSIADFIHDKKYGIHAPIKFMNYWAKEMEKRPQDFLLIRFEDLKDNTQKELQRIVDFLGVKINQDIIQKAVDFGSMENMRRLEQSNVLKDARLAPVDKKDPNSYKVRKGKKGGFKEELSSKDIAFVEDYIRDHLTLNLEYSKKSDTSAD